jgi:two-component system sensor histidine kinase KdpD
MTRPDTTDSGRTVLFATMLQPSDAPLADMAAGKCELLAAATLIQQWLAAAAAARTAAEAERMRTLLLATVSHDLRTPLAAAKAAVSGLRRRDIQLTADDHDELLATAEESLDLLTHLAVSLLDVSWLQTGVLPVFPRPVNLAEIITRSLDGLGPPHSGTRGNSWRRPDHDRLSALGTKTRDTRPMALDNVPAYRAGRSFLAGIR